ncbi:hypothetical protein ACJA28_01240 [Mesomycoplasma moatsii]|uniref:hypothetical protein n=1 Tax=Mesomycoplasma moatsii TaxID=171287 RepID=UPI0003B4D6D2
MKPTTFKELLKNNKHNYILMWILSIPVLICSIVMIVLFPSGLFVSDFSGFSDWFVITNWFIAIYTGFVFIINIVALVFLFKNKQKVYRIVFYLYFLFQFILTFLILLSSYIIPSSFYSFIGESNQGENVPWIGWIVFAMILSAITLVLALFFPIIINIIFLTKSSNQNQDILEEYQELYKQAQRIKINAIVSFFIWITIIGAIVYLILNFIGNIKVLAYDWKDKELNDKKILWGILSLLLIQGIGLLVFSIKVTNKYQELSSLSNMDEKIQSNSNDSK